MSTPPKPAMSPSPSPSRIWSLPGIPEIEGIEARQIIPSRGTFVILGVSDLCSGSDMRLAMGHVLNAIKEGSLAGNKLAMQNNDGSREISGDSITYLVIVYVGRHPLFGPNIPEDVSEEQCKSEFANKYEDPSYLLNPGDDLKYSYKSGSSGYPSSAGKVCPSAWNISGDAHLYKLVARKLGSDAAYGGANFCMPVELN